MKSTRQRQVDNDAFIQSGLAVTLLSQAFKNLADNGRHIPLPHLKLDVVVYRTDATTRLPPHEGGGWKPIWSCTSQTLQLTIAALAQSRLPLHELDIFSQVPRCAVARDQLARLDTSAPGLRQSFQHLKALSISLSNFTGLVHLLQACEASLQRLDIHQYALGRRTLQQHDLCDEKILQTVVQNTQLRALECVRLRGLHGCRPNFVANLATNLARLT